MWVAMQLAAHAYIETMELDSTTLFRITRKGRHALETMQRSGVKLIGSEGRDRPGPGAPGKDWLGSGG